MALYKADLHIHTPASSCFAADASYNDIARAASSAGLDVIATTDHHSFDGAGFLRDACEPYGITVLSGVELTCRVLECDQVFILGLFSDDVSLDKLNSLLAGFGIGRREKGNGGYVIDVPVRSVLSCILDLGGAAVSSRADKTPFRKKAVPRLIEYGITSFDLVHQFPESGLFGNDASKFTFYSFSDAHSPSELGGRYSSLELKDNTSASVIEKLIQKI